MDYATLKDEIQNDPEGVGYDAHLPDDHVSVAELLNSDDPAGTTILETLERQAVRKWAANRAVWVAIEQAGNDSNLSQGPRNAAKASTALFLTESLELDLKDAEIDGFIDQLVSSGVIEQADKDALVSRAERTATRAEAVLGQGTTVDHTDVTQALNS